MVATKKQHIVHQTEAILNKNKLKSILDKKGLGYKEFHEELVDKYGIGLKYVSFMHILDNRATWKLTYAFIIIDFLKIELSEIFELVTVDVEKAVQEKEKRKEKYEK
ncbi:hypothetical protein [Bacillus mojavensis]